MKKIPQQLLLAKQKAHPHSVPKQARFCPECGEDLMEYYIENQHVCFSCHFIVDENDKYCWRCGVEFKELDSVKYWKGGKEFDKAQFTEEANKHGLKDKVK